MSDKNNNKSWLNPRHLLIKNLNPFRAGKMQPNNQILVSKENNKGI